MAVLSQVQELKRMLEKSLSSPEDITSCKQTLFRLDDLSIDFNTLEQTRIGVIVGRLRRHADGEISSCASMLVEKWKKVVQEHTTAGTKPKSDDIPRSKEGESKPDRKKAATAAAESASSLPSKKEAAVQAVKKEEATGKRKDTAASSEPTPSPSPKRPRSLTSSSESSQQSSQASTPPPQMRAAAAAAKGTGQASGSARAQVAQLFAEALSVLPRPEGDGVLDPAAVGRAIEEALLELCGGTTKEYKNKYLSLYTSLKNEKNPLLRERVLRGELDAARLVRMTAQELAPAELIEQQRKSREYHMAAITINAARQDATTDMFQCGRCKERKTTYYQMQTRSADEPMTTFITCVNCGHRWKQG